MGVLDGVPDYQITQPLFIGDVMWRGVYIELKRVDSVPSSVKPNQREFLEWARCNGWVATWARGAAHASMLTLAIYGMRW
jgi:hypothetical protein